jgi:hypothetical protein
LPILVRFAIAIAVFLGCVRLSSLSEVPGKGRIVARTKEGKKGTFYFSGKAECPLFPLVVGQNVVVRVSTAVDAFVAAGPCSIATPPWRAAGCFPVASTTVAPSPPLDSPNRHQATGPSLLSPSFYLLALYCNNQGGSCLTYYWHGGQGPFLTCLMPHGFLKQSLGQRRR